MLKGISKKYFEKKFVKILFHIFCIFKIFFGSIFILYFQNTQIHHICVTSSSALSDQYETLTGYRQYTSNSQGIHHVSYNQVQDDVAVLLKGTPYHSATTCSHY